MRLRRDGDGETGETFEVLRQIEAAVEAPLVAREVARCVTDVDRPARARDRALDVAEPGVDPFEVVTRRSAAGELGDVFDAGLVEAVEAAKPICQYACAGLDVGRGIVTDRLLREAGNDPQMRVYGMAVTRGDGDDERELACRPAPPFSSLFAALVGVVDLDVAGQLVHRV